jgi:hypothetical protein
MVHCAGNKADARIFEQHGAVLNLKRDCHENSLRFALKRDMDQPSLDKKGLKVRCRKFREWAVANVVAAPSSAKQWACARVAFEVSSRIV